MRQSAGCDKTAAGAARAIQSGRSRPESAVASAAAGAAAADERSEWQRQPESPGLSQQPPPWVSAGAGVADGQLSQASSAAATGAGLTDCPQKQGVAAPVRIQIRMRADSVRPAGRRIW